MPLESAGDARRDPEHECQVRVDIRKWPLEIARLARTIHIAAGRIDASVNPPRVLPMCYLDGTFPSDLSTPKPEEDLLLKTAQEWWEKIFTTGEEDGFRRLIEALPSNKPAPVPAAALAAPPPVAREVMDYAGRELAAFISTVSATATAATFSRRLTRLAAAERPVPAAAAPATALRDANRPGVAWWRAFHEQWMEPLRTLPPPAAGGPVAAPAVTPSMADRAATIDIAISQFRQQAREAEFWHAPVAVPPVLAVAAGAPDPSAAVRHEISRLHRSWGFGERHVDPDVSDADACAKLVERAPFRKFGGILSYPTLSKLFGLIVDVVVDRADIEALFESTDHERYYGALSADFGDFDAVAHPDWSLWTATVLGKSVAGAQPYFGPCDLDEAVRKAPHKSDFFRDGILNLSATLKNGTPRFAVSALDDANTTMAFQRASAEIVAADRAGQLPADQSTRFPPLHSSGIKLTDASITAAPPLVHLNRIKYASHLLEAFRFDVGMPPDGTPLGWQKSNRWRTLVGRIVGYPDLPDTVLTRLEPTRGRDEGRIRTALATGRYVTAAGEVETTFVNHDLFVWKGEGLGVPSQHNELKMHNDYEITDQVVVDGRFDLGINLTFDLPREKRTVTSVDSTHCAPTLRERRSYIFGARACLLNGCGPSATDAIERYITFTGAEHVVLGSAPGEPFCFMRVSEVQAPDVLLPWDDPLVTTLQPELEHPGETVETLVIRSGAFATDVARRMLMPARITFDASEVGGVFDDRNQPRTEGAFTGRVRFQSCPDDGKYPIAVAGTIVPDPHEPAKPKSGPFPPPDNRKAAQGAQSRGTVLVLDQMAGVPGTGFHPEPLSGAVCARFCHPGTDDQADGFDAHADPYRFWEKAEHPIDAQPMALTLRRPREGEEKDAFRGWFDADRGTPVNQFRGRPLYLRNIQVVLKPAEEIELELWPHVDMSLNCEGHHVLAEGLRVLREDLASPVPVAMHESLQALSARVTARVAELVAVNPASQRMDARAAQVLDDVLCLGSIPGFCTRRRVRLVHAVDRPLEAPEVVFRIDGDDASPGYLQLGAVVVTVAAETDDREQPAGLRKWSQYAAEYRGMEPTKWPSQANGSTTFFVGSVTLHRASTGSMRCEAFWGEYEAAGVQWDAKSREWIFKPRPVPSTRLFSIEQIARVPSDLTQLKMLDLTVDDSARLDPARISYRALSYAFPDGKARRLTVSLIGTSRYTEFFPPARNTGPGVEGEYESTSRRTISDFWVPSTFRPPVPLVDRIMPLFRWNTTDPDEATFAKQLTWTREAGLRLYLARDSWHATGEGERLAIAFGPFTGPDGHELDLCEFETAVNEFSQFVTRWGADPIQTSFSTMSPSRVTTR